MIDQFAIHPKAKTLLTQPFYFDTEEETSPFGNVDGADAFEGFKAWRIDNHKLSPLIFFKQLLQTWEYIGYDYALSNDISIEKYLLENPLGIEMLIGQDSALIALCFGQLMLEGEVNAELLMFTETALQIELNPLVLMAFKEQYQLIRIDMLQQMLALVVSLKN
jgi:uncharacterized protein YfeS